MNCSTHFLKITSTALFLLLALPLQALSATSLGAFSNNSTITVGYTVGSNYIATTPYPSKITVPALAGPVDIIRVKLNNMNHTSPEDIGVLLVGPHEQAVVLMNGTGGGVALPTNTNLIFDDSGNALTTEPIISGIYQPTNLDTFINFPDPAPLTYNATLSTFNKSDPNGTWKLYVRGSPLYQNTGDISGGWEIEFFSRAGTTIDVQPQDQTIVSGQTATLSVSTMSDDTLSYQWYQGVSGVTTKPVPGDTSSSFTTPQLSSPTNYWVRITSNTGQIVDSATAHITTIAVSSSISNNTAITINDNAVASPYPATIGVSGITGIIKKVRVTLNGINHTAPTDIGVLLVGPQGQKIVLINAVGGEAEISNVNLVFDDTGIELSDNPISSGTYRPTNLDPNFTFPIPAPTEPYGTNLAAFNGQDPNGQWRLYVIDAVKNFVGSISGGWQIEFFTNTDYSLRVNVDGSGQGSVTYQQQAVSLNTTYETTVATGDLVTLIPTTDQYSLFTGWSGVTGCSSATCQFNINADTTATATFTLDKPHAAFIDPNYYATIAEAYAAGSAPSEKTIKLWGINFTENLLLDQDKTVTLKGGYNGTYGAQDAGAFTTITGNLKIRAGRVNADRIVIKQ